MNTMTEKFYDCTWCKHCLFCDPLKMMLHAPEKPCEDFDFYQTPPCEWCGLWDRMTGSCKSEIDCYIGEKFEERGARNESTVTGEADEQTENGYS